MKAKRQQKELKSPSAASRQLSELVAQEQMAARQDNEKFIHVDKRKRKRSISRKLGFLNNWNENDAKRAIQLEQTYIQRDRKAQTLIISFPDESIKHSKVQAYSKNIEKVKFIENVAQRYCHVKLKPDVDAKAEIAKFSKIPFQKGFLRAKLRPPPPYEPPPLPLEVDPTTLYIGNLPVGTYIAEVRKLFKNAVRIDMGYSLKSKWRRYALIKFRNAIEASKAFERSYDAHLRQMSLVLRFHRVKNWEVLKKAEILNELEEIRAKKEQIDAEYDKALQRAKSMVPAYFPLAQPLSIKEELFSPHLAGQRKNIAQNQIHKAATDLFRENLVPAYFPFAQPIIVKQEPESPNSEENRVEEQPKTLLQDENQFNQISMDAYTSHQFQEQPADQPEMVLENTDTKCTTANKDNKKHHKKHKSKSKKEPKDTTEMLASPQDKTNPSIMKESINEVLTKSIFDVEETATETKLMDAKHPIEKPKKRKSSSKPSNQGAERKRMKSKEKHSDAVQSSQAHSSTEFLVFGASQVNMQNQNTSSHHIYSPHTDS